MTRLGLFVRAVTQNRAMAGCVGVRTAKVDTLAFGLGAGVAGLGGVALSQIGNVGPDLGQAYIVDSFMAVVLGGVGQLAGTIVGSFGLGILNKFLEPFTGAVLAKIAVLVLIVLFIQRRPQGLFALKGRARTRRVNAARMPRRRVARDAAASRSRAHARCSRAPAGRSSVVALLVNCVLVPIAALVVPADSPFAMTAYGLTLVGKIMCYALVAVALDLVWGYCGILSLGHGLFFALGGYAMGMYLMRQIGRDGVYQMDLPDFMVFLDWKAAAVVLAWQRLVPVGDRDDRARARHRSRSCSAGSRSARA